MQIPFYKKILSFVYPMTLETTIGKNMTVLTVQLFQNQLMLVTPRAIYSYGLRYNPFRKTFKHIEARLPNVNSFLLLGTGLGSALHILQQSFNSYPTSTLVDNDEDILKLSINYMNLNTKNNVTWTCDDAVHFLQSTSQSFDLIGIDIFRDLVQPEFTYSESFMHACHHALNENGICIFNMILFDDNQIVEIDNQLKKHFKKVEFILDKINTYYICYN